MKKLVVTLSVALASLLGVSAFAQTQGPGEDRSAATQSATPTDKAAAKAARKSVGKGVSKAGVVSDKPESAAVGKRVSKSEKALAKAKRRAEGAAAVKAQNREKDKEKN